MTVHSGSKRLLQPVTVADAATAHLRERLFSGAYAPGAKVKDTAVSAELDIARPTARIAVQQLIAEGLLERDPGYSAKVRVFTPEEVQDLFRVRMLAEIDAVRTIKTQHPDLSKVQRSLEGFRGLGARDEWAEVSEADAAFHQAVVDTAGSPRLSQFFAGITHEMRLLIAFASEHYGRGANPYAEHEELYVSLSGGDPGEATEQVWRFHLEEAREFHLRKLSFEGDTAPERE